jgi:glycosyltransferase involved in cell wall biosynthesis
MKVVQVLYSGLGGHGSVFRSLVLADKDKELQNTAIFYGIEEIRSEYVDLCQEHQIPFHFVPKKPGIDLKSWKQVVDLVVKAKPDVLVVHSINLTFVGLYIQMFHKVKMILVEHNPIAVKDVPDWIYSYAAMMFAKEVAVLSDDHSKSFRKIMGRFYRPEKVTVINNGIDVNLFSPPAGKRSPDEKGYFTFSMQSRFAGTKDHATLIRAFARALPQLNGIPAVLKLAGDGETWQEMKDLAKELGVAGKVEFVGMLAEPDLIELLADTDLYFHSSLAEAMSTAVMQAMSMELPIIATDIPGINNLISDNKNGLLFKPHDLEDLTRKMVQLYHNPQQRQEMARLAREHAVNTFSHYRMLRQYIGIIK